ncbi:MAG: hypothetical protein IPM48_00355 [Saprospiraceae bacterium]|nr:hypothetical protein [Saprospiraceae bacterium]
MNSLTFQPFIYFGVFQPDANASEKSLAIDLKLYYELADPVGLIAHEYHYFLTMIYRKKFMEFKNDGTSLNMKSISQLQLEGIDDLIDKYRFFIVTREVIHRLLLQISRDFTQIHFLLYNK